MKTRSILEHLEPYVPGKRIPGGIKLSSNENPHGPSPRALDAIAAVATDIHRYPDGGMHLLREAIARRWNVSADMVVVGNGSDEILVMIAGALLDSGTNVVTGQHTFSQYTFAAQIFGAEVRTVSMPDGSFDLSGILAQIDDQTRIVFLCSPNNPTGTIIGTVALERFLADVSPDVLVVVDEAYGEYVESRNYPDTIGLVREHPNLIRLRTFSKIYGLAALRVGYGIAQPQLIEAIGKLRQPFNVGTIAQAAAAAALEDSEFVSRSLETNREGKARLYSFLDETGIEYYATEANFVCARMDGVVPGGTRQVIEALREQRIAIRPLRSFGLPEYARISIGLPEEMDALYEALSRTMNGAAAGG
ncbi:MAG: histidinol-phosphate transaminase [Spirochaetota bacterium]